MKGEQEMCGRIFTVVDLIFFFPRKKKGKKTQHVLPTIAGTKHVLGCHHHHHPREKERNDVLRAKNPKINVRYLEAKRLRRMSFDVWIYNLQLEYIIYLYILRFLKQSCHGFHHCHFQCLRLEYCCFT